MHSNDVDQRYDPGNNEHMAFMAPPNSKSRRVFLDDLINALSGYSKPLRARFEIVASFVFHVFLYF